MATVARRCEGVGAGARRSQVIFLPASGILPPDSSGFVISPFLQNTVQTKTEFFRDGMPRRIEFTLSLKRVDESLSDMFGDLSAQLNNLQDTATSALSDISKTVGGLLS